MLDSRFFMSIYTPYRRIVKDGGFKHVSFIMEFPGLYFAVQYAGTDWEFLDFMRKFRRDSLRFFFGKCQCKTAGGTTCKYYSRFETPPMFGHPNTKRVCGTHAKMIDRVIANLDDSRRCKKLYDEYYRII